MTDAAAAAQAISVLTAPTVVGTAVDLPSTVFDRLGVERRVLGFITDEVDKTALGPRNTLHALTYALMNDESTTNPPIETHGRLEIAGLSLEAIAQAVLDIIQKLIEAGLVVQRGDGSYEVTSAGFSELHN